MPMLLHNPSLLWDVLPVIYHHLSQDFLETPSSGIGHDHFPYEVQFKTLAVLHLGIQPTQLDISRISRTLQGHWDVIWKWCRFFIEGYIDRRGTSPKTRARLHIVVIGLLLKLSKCTEFIPSLVSTPSFIPSVTRVWKAELGWYIEQPTHSSVLVLICLIRHHHPSDMYLQIVMSSLGSSCDEFSALCIERVNATSSMRPRITACNLEADIAILCFAGEDPLLYRSLMAADAISALTQAMARLTSHTRVFDNDPASRACLQLSATFVTKCMNLDGTDQVFLALRGRILLSIFKTQPIRLEKWTGSAPELQIVHDNVNVFNNIYTETLKAITPYLTFRHVLHHAVKSMKTISTLDLERKLEIVIPRHMTFWDAWATFKQYCTDRVACKVSFSHWQTFSRLDVLRSSCSNSAMVSSIIAS